MAKQEKIPDKLIILCPYCRKEWTARMNEELSSSQGCPSCGCGGGIDGTIDIRCDHCNKLVYRKNVDHKY